MRALRWSVTLGALLLAGCVEETAPSNQKRLTGVPVPALEGPRFEIHTQGSFKAGFENNVREVLIITDRQTGREYLCVTDASIAELKAKEAREKAAADAVQTALDGLSNE